MKSKVRVLFNRFKIFRSGSYNSVFDLKTGYFLSKSSLDYSPYGPETIEVEICKGGCPHKCKFCYRNNDGNEVKLMTFEKFKLLVSKLPETVTQISLGVTGLKSNPDLLKIVDYCNELHIRPNITITGIDLDKELATVLSKKLGGIGVSVYPGKEKLAYRTLSLLKDCGAKQVGYQIIVAKETLDFTYKVICDMLNGVSRKANHLVIITPKPVEGSTFTLLGAEEYRNLLKFCLKQKIDVGLDQCSKPRLSKVISKDLIDNIDSCECSFYTAFIDVDGNYWHCGFAEISGVKFYDRLNVFECNDFVKDIWNCLYLSVLRSSINYSKIDGCRLCPLFPSINDIDS